MSDVTLTEFLRARLHERVDLAEYVFDQLRRMKHMPAGISFNGRDVYDLRHEMDQIRAVSRIVGLCQHGDWSDPHFHSLGEPDERGDVLALLALPYADHPDYDPAWAPTA